MIPATPNNEKRMKMITSGQASQKLPQSSSSSEPAPPPLPPLPSGPAPGVYPPTADAVHGVRPPLSPAPPSPSSSSQPPAPSGPPPPLPPGTVESSPYTQPSPSTPAMLAESAFRAGAMEKGEKAIVDDFKAHAARDYHKIPYLVIASATIFFALIAMGIGAAVSQRAAWSVYGVWWSAFLIVMAGVPGIVAALTGDLVSVEGNVWVIVTATASGVAAVVAIVNASIVGTYYMFFNGYNFSDSFLVASEVRGGPFSLFASLFLCFLVSSFLCPPLPPPPPQHSHRPRPTPTDATYRYSSCFQPLVCSRCTRTPSSSSGKVPRPPAALCPSPTLGLAQALRQLTTKLNG